MKGELTNANKKSEELEQFECFACERVMNHHVPRALLETKVYIDSVWRDFISPPVRICL